jgi:hypothetical protein
MENVMINTPTTDDANTSLNEALNGVNLFVDTANALTGGFDDFLLKLLGFGSDDGDTTQYRLSRLFHHEFLDRHFMPVVAGGPASSPILYTLGKRGAHLLLQACGYEPEQLHRFPKRLPWRAVEHSLQINDVRIAITLACRAHNFTLETWLDEATFRARPDYVTLTDERGKASRKPVLPDGYFCLTVPQGRARFFLEVDRATEPHSKFRPQVLVYEAYTRSGLYQQRFGARSLRILIVTTTPQRLAHLKATARGAGGSQIYWFSTVDRIRPETVLTASIWERLDGADKYPLIALKDQAD